MRRSTAKKALNTAIPLYTVNGLTADFTTGNAYWAIYVNGEYGSYGLSQQPVTDGDTYAIVYETYAA